MAVEIPVIVDIEQAFEDAASRVGTAMKPLEKQINNHSLNTKITIGNLESSNEKLQKLNAYFRRLEDADWSKVGSKLDLSPYINRAILEIRSLEKEIDQIQELRVSEGGRGDFSFAEEYNRLNAAVKNTVTEIAALEQTQKQLSNLLKTDNGFKNYITDLSRTNIELLQMQSYYERLEKSSFAMADSIDAIKSRMSSLNEKWNSMTKAERTSPEGDRVKEQYKEELRLLKEEALTLDQILQKEQREAEAINAANKAETERTSILNSQANTISQLNAKIQASRQVLESTSFNTSAFEDAAAKLREVEQEMELVQRILKELGMKTGSLDSLNLKLQDLQKRWQSMGESEMFKADGTLTNYAEKTREQYTKIAQEIEKRNSLLSEQIKKQQEAEATAKRKAEEEERAILREIEAEEKRNEAERKHKEALSMAANSMQDLNAKLSAWQQELNTADIGSAKFVDAAQKAAELKNQIQAVSVTISQIGMNSGSIDLLNSKLQEINRQFNALSASDRRGDKGQKLLDNYRKISQELKTEGKTLSQIVAEEEKALQKEQQRLSAIQKNIDRRRYEERVLKLVGNNMRTLQEQERILSERLNKANYGTNKYVKLSKRLDEVRQKMQQMKGSVDDATNAFNRQNSSVSRLGASLASYFSIYTVLRFAKQVRDVTGELEYQRVALGHLIQDEEYGASLFERIKAAAIESPFRIKELVTYTKQLAAYRIEQEELFPTMMRLADVSAGLGVEMDRLILAYGQVRAASVLRGQELRQFTEAGIPLVELLAEKFTELNGKMTSTSEVFELISKRAVPFSMISEIFEDLTEKGGMFYEMQERQAETLQGRWEKLKDAFDIGLQSVGDTKTFQVYNDIFLKGLTALANHLNLVPKLLEAGTVAWLTYSAAQAIATRNAKKNLDMSILNQVHKQVESATISNVTIKVLNETRARHLLTKALYLQQTATNFLTKAWAKLKIAMITNPIGAIIAAVGALATIFLTFRKRIDATVNSFQEFDDLIENTSKNLKDVSRIDKLIDRYERLASMTDRTIKENNRLYQTMTLLQETFPEVAIGIEEENGSLDGQIKKLKELNALKEKETRDNAEAELAAKQIQLEEEEEKRAQLYRKRLKAQQDAAYDMSIYGKETPGYKKAIKAAGEYTEKIQEADKAISGLQKRIEQLNRILHPEKVVSTMSEWKKVIREIGTIETETGPIQLFDDEEIEKWETLDEALSEIAKRKKEMQDREETLADAVSNTTGKVQEETEAMRQWADIVGDRYKQMEDYFSSPTTYAKDIIKNFKELLFKTYDKDTLRRIGDEMTAAFPQSSVKLLERPLIDAAKLVEKGWEDAGDGIATVFSSIYDFEDSKGKKRNIMVTPILPDGNVLTPEELDAYVQEVIKSENFQDDKGLVIGVDVSEYAGENLHKMQAEFYELLKLQEVLKGKSANKFLFTEGELAKLNDATDVLDMVDDKISSIEKEIETANGMSLSPDLSKDAKQEFDAFKTDLETILEYMQKLRERYAPIDVALSDLASNFSSIFPNILESAYEGVDKEVFSKMGLFSKDDLKKITTIVDLYDLWAKKYKAVNGELENYNQKLAETIDLQVRENIIATIHDLEEQKKALEEVQKTYGFLLQEGSKGGYEQDPWILIFKNRVKFMKDFRDGVEDLNKYLAQTESLSKTQSVMKGRGAALDIDVDKLKGSGEELKNYYDDIIDQITKKIQKLGGKTWSGLGVQAILAKDTKDRTLKAWQDLLADVFKERTDFDFSQLKKDIEDGINRVKEEVKRSETARNFYNDILGLTGDVDLSTTLSISIYGKVGGDFRERMKQQLDAAFKDFDRAMAGMEVTGVVETAINEQDFDTILKYIDMFPEEWQNMLRQMASDSEKYNADWVKNLVKVYEKTKTYEERITTIKQREAQQRVEIDEWELKTIKKISEDNSINEEEKLKKIEQIRKAAASYRASSTQKEQKDIATVDVEELKATYEWTKAFEDLDRIGSKTLNSLAEKIQALIDKQKEFLTPEQLKAMQEALDKIQSTMAARDPIAAISSGMKRSTLIRQAESAIKSEDSAKIEKATKAIEEFNKNAEETEQIDLSHLEDSFRDAQASIEAGIKGLETYIDAWGQVANGLKTVRDYMADVFDVEDIPVVDEVLDGVTDSLSFIAGILPVIITLNAILNGTLMLNPFIAIGAAIVATIGAIVGLIKGIVNAKVEKANKKIEEQDKILNNLEKSYERLEKAMEDAFGSDYIYNYTEQLKILEAEIEAYNKQAEAEKSKGKKADQDAIDGYIEKAEEAKEKIADKQGQLSEFFTGTDLTSAAKDFASAWIEAYQSFSSTTSAMKDKFKEVIDNMVVNSLAAAVIQKILKPVFDSIDELSLAEGELSAQDIKSIADLTVEKTEQINTAMSALMQQLTAAGINMRATGSSLSGISKDIASASEESINSLAAGINTQNFYMSYMPTISANVEAILMALTGTAPTTAASKVQSAAASATSTFGDETFRGQMSRIDENIADVRQMLRSVITPKTASVNTHSIGVKS